MNCREKCGACCIAPSISSTIPGMPDGKAAGVPCIHLDANYRCQIFNHPDRPLVCGHLQPCLEMCQQNRIQALDYLTELEKQTQP
ncbi:YkgJ family cysteine cluster protein [Zophobihabitans entericus]|uniref:YkgJ family cysteine cluster protein n=1 Tax=Zophobihabitans entericus TaxID=1635327 RepID=A0A6G9ICP5_9GAMM|nr:YkgJ family cysteine cluster protein [Zophobihabitans entericus]QIQ21589.1 YkgJ family cysteine cluster protein [Zophobihabitans entericus]